jgi:hypothetical protein
MKHHIFISYSSKDAKIASLLVNYLETQGIPCWIAPRNIASGHDYTDSIDEAIKSCDGFVLIFSANSAKSVWVKKELSLGIHHQKNILPFKISDIEVDGGLNFMLNNLQWIIATNHPLEKFPELVEGLRRYDPTINLPNPTTPDDRPLKRNKKVFLYCGIAILTIIIILLLALHPWSRTNSVETTIDTIPALTETSPTPTTTPSVDLQETTKPARALPDSQAKKAKDDKAKASKRKTDATEAIQKVIEKESSEQLTAEKEIVETNAVEKGKTSQGKVDQEKNKPSVLIAHKQYTKAVSLFNAGRYKEALTIFEKLKSEGATESGLDTYITSCKERMN